MLIKLKVDSLTKKVDKTNPTIICKVETHMLKEEEITIPEYEAVFMKDGANNNGAILIVIKDNIKMINMLMQHEKSIDEALCR